MLCKHPIIQSSVRVGALFIVSVAAFVSQCRHSHSGVILSSAQYRTIIPAFFMILSFHFHRMRICRLNEVKCCTTLSVGFLYVCSVPVVGWLVLQH